MAHSRSPSISSSPSATSSSSQSGTNGPKTNYRPSPKRPQGLSQKLWSQIEMLFSYIWLIIQLVLLVAGLTVLHFSTLMVTLSYVVYGYLKGRREFHQDTKPLRPLLG